MSRTLAFLLAAASLIGCSATPERPILNQFFTASRLRDNTMLAGFSLIALDPRADGIVTHFDITSVTPEQRTPLVADARRRLALETVIADMSINGGRTHVDVAQYDGELVTKEVAVSAPVKLPNGQTAQKTFVITMQR